MLLNRLCNTVVQAYLQHLVRAGLNAGRHVTGIKCQLLNLREIVDGVSVQHKTSHRDQREVFMGPDLRNTDLDMRDRQNHFYQVYELMQM